jgi:hypothetical protein
MIPSFAKDLLNSGNLRIEPHLAKVCSNIAEKPEDAWNLSDHFDYGHPTISTIPHPGRDAVTKANG